MTLLEARRYDQRQQSDQKPYREAGHRPCDDVDALPGERLVAVNAVDRCASVAFPAAAAGTSSD